MIRLTVVIVAGVLALGVSARKQTVGPVRLTRPVVVEARYDTIVPADGAIKCAGYDKPNRATRETFFITNSMPDSLAVDAVCLTLDYFDSDGRQLHSATHTVSVNIPAGETRNVSVPSWDRNNSFHYYLSPAPARRASTPYSVRSRIAYVLRRR